VLGVFGCGCDGSYAWTYPRKYPTGIAFQAQRDGWWYLCKTVLKEIK